MSEDFNQLPGEPDQPGRREQPGQPEQTGQSEQSLAEEQPAPSVSQEKQPGQPVSESIIPERPAYPPSPEFYAQMPAVDPNRPSPGVPVYQPAPAFPPPMPGFPPPVPGVPIYPPHMPGAPLPPLPPGYMYIPANQGFRYDFPPIPPVAPQPLGEAVRDLPRQYKKILFKPGVRSFLEEQGRAEWGIIWIQLLFLTLIQALTDIPYLFNASNASSTFTTAGFPPNFLLLENLTGVILGPALFFAGVGIQYLVARMFKGHGSFKQQAYNQLLYSVPLGIVASLAGGLFIGLTSGSPLMTVYLNPTSSATTPGTVFNGGELIALLIFYLVILGVGIYEIVLNVFSIMAAHRMTGGKASAVVLIPIAVAYVLIFIVVIAIFVVALASMPAIR
ncbi:MAG TPA: YIP1 family protein [Ktedonobacteraceae bacterium]